MRNLKVVTKPDSAASKRIINDVISFQKIYIDISGELYAPFGIHKGDIVEITLSGNFAENQVLAFQNLKLEFSKSLVPGIAYDNFGEVSINNGSEIDRYKVKDILLVGFVSAIIKPFESPNIYKIEKTERRESDKTEISVECAGCGKKATGSREFLSAMAWRVKKDKAECAACW